MVDVQPPDLETKMAILDKKAEQEGIALPEDVRIFIATKTKSNVRELEGALVKLIAYSSVTGSSDHAADGAAGSEAHRTGGQERKVTMDAVIQGRGGALLACSRAAQAEDERAADCLPAADRDVPGKELTQASLAGDRHGVRRKASHHCSALDQENRAAAPE